MELTVTNRRENGLLARTEVYFTVSHAESGTPTRAEIRKALSGSLGGKGGVVILDWARSEFGRSTTRGYAKVYESKERAMELETPPVLIRNGLMQPKKKAEAPKEAPPTPAPAKEEKPKEPPKAEAPKKEEKKEAPPKEEKKEAAKKEEKPAKKEEKPAKKEEAGKEKKPAAKKDGK